MSGFFAVEQGKRYYCELLDHPDTLAGTFSIDGGDIRLSLIRFDQFFHLDEGQALRVRTEGNWIASMFDNIRNSSGQRGGATASCAYYEEFFSNTTVIGFDAWTDADRVKRVSFRIPRADGLFEHSPIFVKAADSEIGKASTDLFATATAQEEISGWLLLSGSLSSKTPQRVEPWITIAFADGRTLDNMRAAVARVVRFLSSMSGVALAAEEITISRYSKEDYRARIEKCEQANYHSVYYYFSSPERTSAKVDLFHTLASLRDESCRSSFEAALAAWIVRDDEWSAATALMMEWLRRVGVMSGERLLTATRWLEDTPGTQAQGVIDRDHVKALGKLVGKWAGKLGYGSLAGRFKNALALIALESNRERFQRLVGEVRAAFGQEVVGDDIVDWLLEAMKFRGPAAHRARTGIDDDYRVFARAVYAIECLDLLIMLKDLPIGADAIERAPRHPLVQEYRLGCHGQTPTQVRAS